VKSVLRQFSSGVSICRNKGTQSDIGAPFCLGNPGRGILGPFLRLCSSNTGGLEVKKFDY